MSKKFYNVIGFGLLLFALILTQIPMQDVIAANGMNDFKMNQKKLARYEGSSAITTIPSDVKTIGEEAFAQNHFIEDVTAGKNVKDIKYSAFAGAENLKKISLPDSLECIDSFAFSGCKKLEIINIGPNCKDLGMGVFAGCDHLKDVSIHSDNPYFLCEKGAIYDSNREILLAYLNAFPSSVYRMPDSVKKLSPYSFWGNKNVESIYISSFVKEITGYCFSNCKNLGKVEIPYSVNTIEAKAFENCRNLNTIEIPASVTYIHPTAFDGCYNLEIKAPEGTVGYQFAQFFKNKMEAEKENYVTVEEENNEDEQVSQNQIKPSINASKDPSNVEYMPDRDVLEMPEDDSVKSKSLVIGGTAVMFMDSKGVTVYENGSSIVNPNSTEVPEINSNQNVIIADTEINKENVTVVGSTGSVLPRYVEDSISDEKIKMNKSNSNQKDDSPDTGDDSIPINYILAIGIAAFGTLVLIYSYNLKEHNN